ncbi:sugar transferase [Belnapia sp. T6]|uniref:Sugar transferase n=1 Tax=Belnapia mucosa TaxID=2804532 RepID=A0ABS1V4Q1_9PROT|nr:sugar transferase [Belnapia mucosa]MBL6456674.1 sugar transferase [Belnapia mucosa]
MSYSTISHASQADFAIAPWPAAKRLIDLVGAVVLLALLSPIFLVLAIAACADGGPVFFAHRRIGRGGAEFGCLKFRSMRTDADRALRDLLARDPAARAEWEATRKLKADPRVTRIGRVLRSTSLDELPQLVNVLRGEMSLVGPRPVVRDELERFYAPRGAVQDYLSVRPGVTGPWQVGGRSDTGYEERVALDTDYVRHSSFVRDLHILLSTVGAVIRRQGAC